MANNYVQFSERILQGITEDQAEDLWDRLDDLKQDATVATPPPMEVIEPDEDGNRSGERYVWMHGDYGLDEATQVVLQEFLQDHEGLGPISVELSHNCSKKRVDAFGGSVVVISDDEILAKGTHQMREELLEQVKPDKPDEQSVPSPS